MFDQYVFWGASYTEAQVVYDGCLGVENGGKTGEKEKGGNPNLTCWNRVDGLIF